MFKLNNTYNGFKLIEETEVKEIQSKARIFIHQKTDAKLLYLENNDNNKVFSIGFRTPPSNSTGVPHIIEHSVLSGSRKYITKEPFMDMIRGSLQTFINAMTFSDKTLYPVASRNEKDFLNLMDVYLDAVFYPRIYEVPEIFMQEGWHHEIFDENESMRYKGVVYNEMQGAYSSPETILGENIDKSLYPDTCYRHSSGGNPDIIPNLSYEDFVNFHKKLYHPSNSYIYLYGDMNIKEYLKHIDEGYLSNFNKSNIDSVIEMQNPFASRAEIMDYYPISAEETEDNRSYMSLNFVIGKNTDPETYIMSSVLSQLLVESEAAPLKKALLDAGLGEDVFSISSGGIQPGFGVAIKNTSVGKKEQFEKVFYNALADLVQNGIDKKLIEASINIIEYDLREASGYPTKGIIYNILSLDSWLYEGHPLLHLQYDKTLTSLKSGINNRLFENFIKERILDNPHSSLVIIQPKKGLGDEKQEALQNRLDEYKNSLSQKEIKDLINNNNRLKEMQMSDNTEEAKATIPKLSLSDVEPKAMIIPQEIIKNDEFAILFHDIFTSKIAYIDFYFDISMVDKELIPYISLLTGLLGKIDTERRGYSELSNEIFIHTGGIDFDATCYEERDEDSIYFPKLVIKGKAIGENILKLLELIQELTTQTKIEDARRIKELFQQMKSRIEMSVYDSGHRVAASRVSSYFSPTKRYLEKLKGLDFYWFLSKMLDSFDNNYEEALSNLNKVYGMVFNLNNLVVSFTGDKEDFSIVSDNLHIVIDKLNKQKFESIEYGFADEKLNEGILSAANVQYVSKGYNFKKLGFNYDGSMRVLSTILSRNFLHNEIRAQGGAYGAGMLLDRTGHMVTFSYRDPNLKNTIDVYNNMANYIDSLKLDEEEITSLIIGTISQLDPATTPHMRGQIATNRYISKITQEDVQKSRDEVLATNLEKIKSFSPLIDETMKQNYLCVLGNENTIKENKDLFNNLVQLKR